MRKGKESIPVLSMPTWSSLEDWLRGEIQTRLQQVLEEEVSDFLGRQRYARRAPVDAAGGYRNGYGKPRRLTLSCGTVTVKRPRVRDLEERFESRILPLFARRSQAVGRLLPELYLHGLSLGDFDLALRGLLGEGAALSAASMSRLRGQWETDFASWKSRRLDDRQVVYAWADGIYVRAGLDQEKMALLVLIGAMSDGRKEVLALVPGWRESTQSWLSVLRDLSQRGLPEPLLLVADGHLGLWAAVDQYWPQVRQQRCWNHKLLNVLDKLPKGVQAQARPLLCALPTAPTRQEAERGKTAFARRFGERYPEAVETLERDWHRLVTFYDFPHEHWRHLRTTNIIESPFAAVRLRTEAAKRFKKAPPATALIWRLMMVAQKRFRRLEAAHLLPAVLAGQKYENGSPITKGRKSAA